MDDLFPLAKESRRQHNAPHFQRVGFSKQSAESRSRSTILETLCQKLLSNPCQDSLDFKDRSKKYPPPNMADRITGKLNLSGSLHDSKLTENSLGLPEITTRTSLNLLSLEEFSAVIRYSSSASTAVISSNQLDSRYFSICCVRTLRLTF